MIGCVSSSSGSTSTPPGGAWIRTSRPRTARISTSPSTRLARSVPNARKRPVESSKSYGSGKRSSDIVERVVPLERDALLGEEVGEPSACEDTVRGERSAPVRPAVAHEHDRPLERQRATLAPVAADGARALMAKPHLPAVGRGIGEVRSDLELEPFPCEHRHDQLRQPARDDQGAVALDELVEAAAQLDVLDRSGSSLLG